ncbi:MAG: hypothetical protein ABIG63_05175, partial [Chloroflexota bacterium]
MISTSIKRQYIFLWHGFKARVTFPFLLKMHARFTSRPVHGANDVGSHDILLKSPYRAYHALNSSGIPS